MAEVLGVVASGVGVAAFAVQIGASAQRLVALWKGIRNAPQYIHDLLVEIQVFADILADFEAAQLAGHSVAHSPPSRRALQLCKRVAEDLRIVLDKFDTVLGPSSSKGVKQRTWTAVKAAFRKPEMQEQLERLQRAKMNLVIAGQCSSIAQMAAFRLDQAAENEHLRALISSLTDDTGASATGDLPNTPALKCRPTTGRAKDVSIKSQLVFRSYWTPFGPVQYRSSSNQKQDEDIPSGGYSSWSYWPSSWTFLKHGLEVLGDHSLGRPQFVFRTFRIVSDDSDPAFSAAADGDLTELKRLCALGYASPFDRDYTRLSLMHVAVMYNQPEICSWLIKHGVSVDETMRGNRLYSPLTMMAQPGLITRVANQNPVTLILSELFLNQPHSERITSFLTIAKTLMDATEMDATLFKLAIAVAEHPSVAMLERFHDYASQGDNSVIAPFTAWFVCQGLSHIFRHIWTDLESSIGDDYSQSHRDCVLHEFLNYGMFAAGVSSYNEWNWLSVVQVVKFLVPKFRGHNLLHKRPEHDEKKNCCHSPWCQGSPLLWLFMGFLRSKSKNRPANKLHECVMIWLNALRTAGVDLLAYLKTEERIDVWTFPYSDRVLVHFKFIFKFGDTDEDHQVWANYKIVTIPQQNAEDSTARMPGRWMEYSELDAIEPTGTIGRPINIDSEDDDGDAWDDELEPEDAYRDDWDYELESEVEEEAEV